MTGPLRFGTFLAPSLLLVYQAVTAAVGRHLGVETTLDVERPTGSTGTTSST